MRAPTSDAGAVGSAGDRPIGGEKPLGVPRGLEPLHPSLPLAGGLVGVFGTIIEVAVLAVFHPGQDLPLRRAVALQFIRNDTYPDWS